MPAAPPEQTRQPKAEPAPDLTIDDIIREAGGASATPGRNDPLP
jgi:hypothetical protein